MVTRCPHSGMCFFKMHTGPCLCSASTNGHSQKEKENNKIIIGSLTDASDREKCDEWRCVIASLFRPPSQGAVFSLHHSHAFCWKAFPPSQTTHAMFAIARL
uniref:Uncharacterized protein n=1 Tax=Trypanosoma vivax (strain Y486) TaxID=1055687 RepID=G0U931_TRYVY|nr:hypothetical protein TVY486_1115980 [Trypanosoma vivax Y486]